MAKKKGERKPWQEMTFLELDNKALLEHARSLGKEKGIQALTQLQKWEAEKIEVTPEMKEKKRRQLEKQKKREKQEDGTMKKLDEPLYTADEIEEILSEYTKVPKYSPLALRKKYCKEFYPSVLPKEKNKDKFADEIAKALAELQAGD